MSGSCTFEECTVDETGLCALSRTAATCSNRVANESADVFPTDIPVNVDEASRSDNLLGAPVLNEPLRASAFPSSRTLNLEKLNAMMGKRYVNVVGILGDPESGKTACLVSLYLLISHAKLVGWSFADSKSLAAFEEIARGAREWNLGKTPGQMTVHTELADDHGPGFLHLGLVRLSDGHRFDLALPDMPGEWTQALVNTARSDQLGFMKSAEAIWIVLDGSKLANIETRQGLVARVGQLAVRLKAILEGRAPRLIVVVTHCDSHELNNNTINRLERELTQRGAKFEIVGVAPFSDHPNNVPAGFGIAKLIEMTIGKPTERPPLWLATEPTEGGRAFLNHRRNR